MTSASCPNTAEWIRYADGEVTANRAIELERHGDGCAHCAKRLQDTRQLLDDAAGPIPQAAGAVARVMAALDEPVRQRSTRRWRPSFALGTLAGGALVAAAAVAVFVFTGDRSDPNEYTARGTATGSALERKVGVDVYAGGAPVTAGARIAANTPLSARVRNLVTDSAVHMLLFALDANGDVHWLFPAYVDPATDPVSLVLPSSVAETPLGESVVLDQPAPGPMHIVTVLTNSPLRVSHIEKVPPAERTPAALTKRWPTASVRSIAVTVTP